MRSVTLRAFHEYLRLPDAADVLEAIGLMAIFPPRRLEYRTTPKNSLTFASTGGDGVHFGVLVDSAGVVPDVAPIVMTVPMMFDRPNVIVGGSFHEFLRLGATCGYFCLEDLAYHPERAGGLLSRESDSEELTSFVDHFQLRPLEHPVERLAQLERLWLDRLVIEE